MPTFSDNSVTLIFRFASMTSILILIAILFLISGRSAAVLYCQLRILLHLIRLIDQMGQRRRKQCKDAVDGCRLSGAVWSKQTEDLTFLNCEIEVIEGDKLLIAFYQIFYFYNRY